MTLQQALSRSREVLANDNVADASLEAEVLLRHSTGINRVQLYADIERELSLEQEAAFWALVQRRLRGEPSAYITGHREFYGLDFQVDRRVLIPRPESELLVEKAVSLARQHPSPVIAEIGTGSGAIAVCLARELPQARIYATDISAGALEVAGDNCRRHGVADRITLLRGNLLEPLPEAADVMVSNLPYVALQEIKQGGLDDYEPSLALDGGSDGLEKIRELGRQLDGKLQPGGYLLLEVGQGQAEPVKAFLRELFPSAGIYLFADLAGIARVVALHN